MKNIELLAKNLRLHMFKLVTAESCTGGLIAKQCTDIAGSSTWFERGFVTYSNESKIEMLSVDQAEIKQKGAVSQIVAEGMAQGALKSSHAHISVAVTGIAGPDGGTTEKPVGTVWIAWAMMNTLVSQCYSFEGTREDIREKTAQKAIVGLNKMIEAIKKN